MTSSTRQLEPTRSTPSTQEYGVLHTIIKYISNLKTSFIRRCGIYIDLLKLYTVLGYILEKFRGPTTLAQWAHSKHMTTGFLSETVPLPHPDKLSLKPSNISRIITWVSYSLLQAGKLALTPENYKLAHKLHILRFAIASNDPVDICHATKNLVAILLSPPILNQIPSEISQRKFVAQLHIFVNILITVDSLHYLDRKSQNLTTLNQNNTSTTYELPTNETMFLEAAIKQAAPEIRRAQMTQEDFDKAHRTVMLTRKIKESQLHFLCRLLEPSQKASSDDNQKVNNTIDQLEKMLDRSCIPDDPMLLLNALSDNINGHTDPHSSPLIELIVQQAPKLFSEEITISPNDTFLFRQTEVYKLLNAKPALQTQLVDHLNALLLSAVQQVSLHMTSALTAQGEQDPSDIIRSVAEDLMQNYKFSTPQIQTFISPDVQDDFLQFYASDSACRQEQPMELDEFIDPEQRWHTSTKSPTPTSLPSESLNIRIDPSDPNDFESISDPSDDSLTTSIANELLIIKALNKMLQQIPHNIPSRSRLISRIETYQKSEPPTSLDVLSDIVTCISKEILPNIPSKENKQQLNIELLRLIALEILENNRYKSELQTQLIDRLSSLISPSVEHISNYVALMEQETNDSTTIISQPDAQNDSLPSASESSNNQT